MKSNKTQVYISAPYRPKVKSTIEKLRAHMVSLPQPDIKGRQIDIAPWPDYIDADGFVHFQDNGRLEYQVMKHVACKPDIVVYATGYTQVFSFLDESYPTIFDADIRRVWKANAEDVGFIGFVRPSFGMPALHLMTIRYSVEAANLTSHLGAIPPLAELQAQLWVTNLFNRLPRPIQINENYLLKPDVDRRLDYIVDHETYAQVLKTTRSQRVLMLMGRICSYRLACDMGAAPSILQTLAFGPIVFLTWALGPNFNTKFRLVGPWKWDGAAAIIKGEHWKVIKRRKGFISKLVTFI